MAFMKDEQEAIFKKRLFGKQKKKFWEIKNMIVE